MREFNDYVIKIYNALLFNIKRQIIALSLT